MLCNEDNMSSVGSVEFSWYSSQSCCSLTSSFSKGIASGYSRPSVIRLDKLSFGLIIKDVGHFWLYYITNNTKSWDSCQWVLTIPTLRDSRISFTGPIYLIEKARPTNSSLPVQLESTGKGSGAPKYLEISPGLSLKEHFIPTAHRTLNQYISNLYINTNSFM